MLNGIKIDGVGNTFKYILMIGKLKRDEILWKCGTNNYHCL